MKRFTDTDIWTKNLWFRKLSKENKLLWFFIKDNCDSVGVWEIDIEFAEMLTGCKYNLEQILTDFKKQVIAFKDNRKIWIKDFCNFQYEKISRLYCKHVWFRLLVYRLQTNLFLLVDY